DILRQRSEVEGYKYPNDLHISTNLHYFDSSIWLNNLVRKENYADNDQKLRQLKESGIK
ncbi:hypothetical protein NPIL_579431, partial [Nephila pilipes]